jgi:hypothetical protein
MNIPDIQNSFQNRESFQNPTNIEPLPTATRLLKFPQTSKPPLKIKTEWKIENYNSNFRQQKPNISR